MKAKTSAAIYYHPEAYTTSGPKLMGRNAAGESFLRGYLAHSRSEEFWAQVDRTEHAEVFAQTVRAAGRNEPVRSVDRGSLGALAEAGTVYYPGPGIGQHAWHRSLFGSGSWSLCGITHTTASASAMDAITELLTVPVQPWDALICTSAAVKDNALRLLQAQADYLEQRLGVQRLVLPEMPVIPLGVHTADFSYTAEQRAAARRTVGAEDSTLVVLFMGRLSFHAKAHPLAMYQALQGAARGREVVLVECGWHANEFIARAYADAAKLACPSVRVLTLDGRDAADRQTAWACADVFCSLSDNIQETFGIVPIEAMAAGMPVVVSDWDGYRDTVRDGVDGFRIPTLMPQAGLGIDLGVRHALGIDNYDHYCGQTCSLVAVDVAAATVAFERLFASAELRAQMGAAGRQRARDVYDWEAIIARYEELWARLGEVRHAEAGKLPALSAPWPARMDPFAAFVSYPTGLLTPETVLGLGVPDPGAALAAWQGLAMVNFARAVMPSDSECQLLLGKLVAGPQAAGVLVGDLPDGRQAYVFRALAWLVKLGILRRAEAN